MWRQNVVLLYKWSWWIQSLWMRVVCFAGGQEPAGPAEEWRWAALAGEDPLSGQQHLVWSFTDRAHPGLRGGRAGWVPSSATSKSHANEFKWNLCASVHNFCVWGIHQIDSTLGLITPLFNYNCIHKRVVDCGVQFGDETMKVLMRLTCKNHYTLEISWQPKPVDFWHFYISSIVSCRDNTFFLPFKFKCLKSTCGADS